MIRRFGFVILVLALIVSACGRQVTPDRPGTNGSGLPSGYMSVKFRVMQPFNFQNYSYMIVFNTSGDGTTPRANGTQTNYAGYNFAILVSGATGNPTAQVYQYYRPPGFTAPQLIALQATQQQLQFYPNTNGQNTEFTVIFQRNLFFGINNTPSPSPSSSASASPSASPSPSGSPSASPSSSPTTPPSGAPAEFWNFNFFVAQGPLSNLLPVDSLGANPSGAADTTYTSPSLDTFAAFTQPITLSIGTHPSDQGADSIATSAGEIANSP